MLYGANRGEPKLDTTVEVSSMQGRDGEQGEGGEGEEGGEGGEGREGGERERGEGEERGRDEGRGRGEGAKGWEEKSMGQDGEACFLPKLAHLETIFYIWHASFGIKQKLALPFYRVTDVPFLARMANEPKLGLGIDENVALGMGM